MRSPGDARSFHDSAMAAVARGDLAAAVAALEAAVSFDPTRAEWHHRLGRLRLRRRRWREAVAAFEAAQRLEPDRALRHYWLGRARERCWDLAGARAAYAAAVELAPQRPRWVERLAEATRAQEQFHPYAGLVIAHRGRCGDLAENAVESISALPGHVSGVEVDVRLSRDGVPVLLHDPTVDRTMDGRGPVDGLTYRQVRGLRGAGGVRVPSLAEYLDACAGHGFSLILLDVKSVTGSALDTIRRVVEESAVAESCVLMVRDEQQLAQARRTGLRVGGFGLTGDNASEWIAAALRHRAELLLVAFGSRRYLAHRRVVGLARRAGLRAGASTVNSWQALSAARSDACDLLLTDVAEQLDRFTGGRGVRVMERAR